MKTRAIGLASIYFTARLHAAAITAAIRRRGLLLLAIAPLILSGGCTKMPSTGITSMEFSSFGELQRHLLSHKPELQQFKLRGPFTVTTRNDLELQLSATQRVVADLYLSAHSGKGPLVILLHGYANSKDDHAYQAMHLATWGMHSLALQLPNKGPWSSHGRTLARLVDLIQKHPEDIDVRIDPRKVILLGHSFGGSSVVFALGLGAPVAGGILLDPATTGRDLTTFLRKVDKPVMLIGADEDVSLARGRDYFYKHIPHGIAEISIRGADHDDAQFSMEDDGTNEKQLLFTGALTAAAFSLAATGRLDYAWSGFGDGIANGTLIKPRKK